MSNTKKNMIAILKLLLVLGFAGLFVTILISAKSNIENVVCTDIDIKINEKNGVHFLTEKEIVDYINNTGISTVINKKVKDIDKAAIEKRIESNKYVQNAEVFSNFEGKLRVKVNQRTPFYRVFNNEGVSYYVDANNEHIPLSTNFTPRLIVATGYLTNSSLHSDTVNKRLNEIVNFINEDEFWEAMIGQIDVTKSGDFVLYSKIAEHNIIFGSTNNMEDKFKRLKVFYKKGLKYVDWKQYESINLKYKNQIICTKK